MEGFVFVCSYKKINIEKPKQDTFPGIRKLISSDGFLILAGKNAKDNNKLTVQILGKMKFLDITHIISYNYKVGLKKFCLR